MSDIQAEFERLRCSGDEHYGRKEYSIAAECYRSALERGPGDRSLLFNFAYSLAATKNDTGAALIYQQAIQAGSGAAAHNNLGLCYGRLGKHQEGRDEFIKATKLERFVALYWRNLAARLTILKEPKAELNALEALSTCEGCTAGDWNKLGCAREREGDVEGGLTAFRNAASAAPKECTYIFNIALMHDRSGRVLDAYHACRHSLNLNNGYEPAAKMMPKLEKALERPPAPPPLPSLLEYKFNCPLCGQHISANESLAETRISCPSCAGVFIAPRTPGKPREIGPHDYVNPYALLNLSAVSELPEAFEWFEQPADWDELLGSLTRRRRALKAELELNEGSLSWMPQLHITDEVVHRVLSDLDDSGWHPHHWAVFRLPLLNRFLMHGELDYFHSLEDAPYPLVAEIAGAAPDDFEQEEFVTFISAFFRHRWAPAIKQALDAGNYAGASTLFSTSAPVTAADLDEALEPVRRHFARRREALKQLEDSVESGSKTSPDAQLQFAASEAKLLNVLPTHLGAKLRDDMCFAYRSISIALANHRGDYTASEWVLKVAESFQASVTTKQRLAEDRTTISGLLRREQEEKERLERLSLRVKVLSREDKATLDQLRAQAIQDGAVIAVEGGEKAGVVSYLLFDAVKEIKEARSDKTRTALDKAVNFAQRELSPIGLENLLELIDERTDKLRTFRDKCQCRVLEITPKHFHWSSEGISSGDIDGVRFGVTGEYGRLIFLVSVRSASGATISVDCLDEETFAKAVNSLLALHSSQIMKGVLENLHAHGYQIGNLLLSKKGISFETGIIFTKQRLIPWADAETKVASGDVQISSRNDPKALTTVPCREHWNACLLPTLIEIMKSSAK